MAILKSFGKACIIALVVRLVEHPIVSSPRFPVQRLLPSAVSRPTPVSDFSFAKLCPAGSFLLAKRAYDALRPFAC